MASYGFAQAVFDRSRLGEDEDVAVITSHFRKIIDNFPDFAPIDQQARDDYYQRWTRWWTVVRPHIFASIHFLELRVYDVNAAPGGLLGDPVSIYPINLPGASSSGALPPQVSGSVTFRTAHRLRWGRMYVPGLSVTAIDGNGRFTTTLTQDLALGAHELTDRSGTGGALTVFSRKYWNHEDPDTIQVDDVPDVIRRRRFHRKVNQASIDAG